MNENTQPWRPTPAFEQIAKKLEGGLRKGELSVLFVRPNNDRKCSIYNHSNIVWSFEGDMKHGS